MGAVEKGYLLDTHTFLWSVLTEQRLGKKALAVIGDTQSAVYFSPISAYEIINKYRIGKLDGCEQVVGNIPGIVKELGVRILDITLEHTVKAASLKWRHRDPFDRLLVAQAQSHGLILITDDKEIKDYKLVKTVW
jgi:PIN domain nuclease of toxin-antitoxin system